LNGLKPEQDGDYPKRLPLQPTEVSNMKIYEDYSQSPDGWNIASKLTLEDNGRFLYDETWTDYTNATIGGEAEGRWRGEGEILVFLAERVEGSMYCPWAAGQEMEAVERGDCIDFGRGYTLRVPPERELVVPVHNTGVKPLTVVLEPWGIRHELAPGEQVRVVARGPWGPDGPKIVRSPDEVVVYGWSGSRAAVVPEAQQTMAPAAEAAKQTVKPPDAPPAPATAVPPEPPRFEPRTPSPELAARIRRWVDELPPEGVQQWVAGLCKVHDSIPLHCTQIYLWTLRTDGQVLCIDHESFARRAEPETNPVTAYAALAQGARAYPELGELLWYNPAEVIQCDVCGGAGWTQAQPPVKGTNSCHWCDGMGWHAPRVPR
jgi:hypothetical protein